MSEFSRNDQLLKHIFAVSVLNPIIFQKIQTAFFLQDIVGVETFAKNMILLNQISTLFSTIWLQVLPFWSIHQACMYVFGYFAFWYQIWNWIVSGILFFKINVPLLVDTLRLQKYAKLYCLSNFIYLWSFWDWHSFANSNSAWRRLEYSNRKKSDNLCVFLHTFLTRKM